MISQERLDIIEQTYANEDLAVGYVIELLAEARRLRAQVQLLEAALLDLPDERHELRTLAERAQVIVDRLEEMGAE